MDMKVGQWVLKRSLRCDEGHGVVGLTEACHDSMKNDIEMVGVSHTDGWAICIIVWWLDGGRHIGTGDPDRVPSKALRASRNACTKSHP